MAHGKQISAGLLVFRRRPRLELLLGHPGGPFWARKDDGAWTIPKGLVEESADLLATAKREFTEETGLVADGTCVGLTPVRQKSGKLVHAFAVEADLDLTNFVSNTFELAWPPRSGRRQTFPEIDRIQYFDAPTALRKVIPYQQPFIHELAQKLGEK